MVPCLRDAPNLVGLFKIATYIQGLTAVNVASMRTTNSQYAETRALADKDLGDSPPPCNENRMLDDFWCQFRIAY